MKGTLFVASRFVLIGTGGYETINHTIYCFCEGWVGVDVNI